MRFEPGEPGEMCVVPAHLRILSALHTRSSEHDHLDHQRLRGVADEPQQRNDARWAVVLVSQISDGDSPNHNQDPRSKEEEIKQCTLIKRSELRGLFCTIQRVCH
jgi:hypothetical protein